MNLHKTAPSVLSLSILVACTWVDTTEQGAEVRLIRALDAQQCERIGSTTSSVKHQLGWFERDQGKVAIELQTLAQNYAATMGGNSLVANSDPAEGQQEFTVYKCNR